MTFQSLAVTLLTTRFNITRFYMVLTLRLCVLYRCQEKTVIRDSYDIKSDFFIT